MVYLLEVSICRRSVLPALLVCREFHDECFAFRSPKIIKDSLLVKALRSV